MFFDAVRYSIEMANLAYHRLIAALEEICLERRDTSNATSLLSKISALQEAWSVVDSSFRLRCLIEASPYLKKKLPLVQSLLKQTQNVGLLRNIVQHLDTEMKTLIELNVPAWGELAWAQVTDGQKMEIISYTFIPGTIFPSRDHHIVNPLGQRFYGPIDLVTLHVGTYSICISDVMRAVLQFASRYNDGLKKGVDEKNVAGGDLMCAVTFHTKSPLSLSVDEPK